MCLNWYSKRKRIWIFSKFSFKFVRGNCTPFRWQISDEFALAYSLCNFGCKCSQFTQYVSSGLSMNNLRRWRSWKWNKSAVYWFFISICISSVDFFRSLRESERCVCFRAWLMYEFAWQSANKERTKLFRFEHSSRTKCSFTSLINDTQGDTSSARATKRNGNSMRVWW